MDISSLLDFSQPYDLKRVEILDELVGIMYGLHPGDRIVADKLLTELKQKADSWRVVGNILQLSKSFNTKFFALSILEKCIQFQWKILPIDQKTGIKQYITELCIELCQDEKVLTENKHFLNKTNETLIMIVKQEWPDNWENFIFEICSASKTNQYICENTMKLLKLLSEEVFDFGEDQMVSKKVEKLMNILNQQFPQIFSLILFVLTSYIENPQNIKVNLVVSSLQCLCHYLKWIPLCYILECDLRLQLSQTINISNNSIQYNLLQLLLDHFWSNPSFRLESIRCLTEIASLKFEDTVKDNNGNIKKNIEDQMVNIWVSIVNRIKEVPNEYVFYDNIPDMSTSMRLYYERYFNYIAILLSSFIKNHRLIICEKYPETIQCLDFALDRMVKISYIQNEEVFKVCIDFWLHFTQQLVYEVLENSKKKLNDGSSGSQINSPLFLLNSESYGTMDSTEVYKQENPFSNPEEYSNRLAHYQPLLCDVRKMIICRMAKPQEVYIAIDPETGEVSRENIPDTDEISLYKTLREILIYLSNLGQNHMEKIIMQLLQEEFESLCVNCGLSCSCNTTNGNQWNPIKLNRLCWAVGSISGTLSKCIERRLIIEVIKSLLMLCERKRGKANKAAVASCVMYVVGQYPRFLKDHWKFLQTVINKLFEFMHETFPGVKDMACEAFLKISMKCKKSMGSNNYVGNGSGNNRSILYELNLGNIDGGCEELKFLKYMIIYSQELRQHLDDKQIIILIQGISLTIYSLKDVDEQYMYITELLKIFDVLYWNDVVSKLNDLRSFGDNEPMINELCSMEFSQKLVIIVRIMETIASSCGVGFARVLIERSSHLVDIYKLYSNFISKEVQQRGSLVVSHAHIKQLRISKREIIKLLNSFIKFVAPRKKLKLSENKNSTGYITELQSIAYNNISGSEMFQYFVQPIIIPILEDYHACISDVKEANVLSLSSTVVVCLNDIVRINGDFFNTIIFHIFECTLSMIKDNFHAYPDHRENFFNFLSDCNEFCFMQLFNLPGNILTLYVESIIWAIRHEQPNMAEKGLVVFYNLLINLITNNKEVVSSHPIIQVNALSQFCHAFYFSLIREIFSVLTDTLHTSGFQYQTMILFELIKIIEFSLMAGNYSGASSLTNMQIQCSICEGNVCKITKARVMEYTAELLIGSFITVQKEQVEAFIIELFNAVHSKTIIEFQRVLHDFLIQIKEFTNEESKKIFEIEKNNALKRAIEIENNKQWTIPGLINRDNGLQSISGDGDGDEDIEDDDE